jgi:hypothetical protein
MKNGYKVLWSELSIIYLRIGLNENSKTSPDA